MFASFQTIDKVAKPLRAIKRNSIRGPRQIENLVGKRSELCEAQETRGFKFIAPFRRQIWSILSQVRAVYIFT